MSGELAFGIELLEDWSLVLEVDPSARAEYRPDHSDPIGLDLAADAPDEGMQVAVLFRMFLGSKREPSPGLPGQAAGEPEPRLAPAAPEPASEETGQEPADQPGL